MSNKKKKKDSPRNTNDKEKSSRGEDEYNADRTSIRANGIHMLSSPSFRQLAKIPHPQTFFPNLKVSRNLFLSDTVLFGG